MVDRIRNQAQNMDANTPGANRRTDTERELFSDFRVKLGLCKAEDTDLINSPDAKFRRDQIYKFKATGQTPEGYDAKNVSDYGR